MRLPFLHIGVARADPACATDSWNLGGWLLRLTVRKMKVRLDTDLDDWTFGVECVEIDDFLLHFGLSNVRVPIKKCFDLAFPSGVPVQRRFFHNRMMRP